MSPRSYLEKLLISKVRIKALHHFFTHPDEPIHLRGAVRELNEEINAVRRELSRMEKIDLLHAERRGNRKYFQLNPDFVFYDELLALVFKCFGLGSQIVKNSKQLGDIQFALLTQSYTRGMSVGKHKMDFLIVGDNINSTELQQMVEKDEKRIGRDIYYAVLTKDDFYKRLQRRDLFVQELMAQELTMLLGSKIDMLRNLKW